MKHVSQLGELTPETLMVGLLEGMVRKQGHGWPGISELAEAQTIS